MNFKESKPHLHFFYMENNIDFWKKHIETKVKGKKTQEALIKYTENLISKKSIVIFDFNHLCKLLSVDNLSLSKVIYSTEHFYNNFEIPKRNGGVREICAPLPLLLNCQDWIYQNLLKPIPIHENCTGFRNGHSIKNNAEPHLHAEKILKLDLKDFFPSIIKERVISVFINLGYTPKLSYCLASICTLNNELPQGAPTSPVLSNIIAKRLDYRLAGLSKKYDLKYTRYADDLTFSGTNLPVKLIEYITKIINNEGFTVNSKKTRLLDKGKRKIITGISVSSNKMTIPKKKKREIRQIIYYIDKYGIENHLNKKGMRDPIYLDRILGYLYFWNLVEKENTFLKDSIIKIKKQIGLLNEKYKDFKEELIYQE